MVLYRTFRPALASRNWYSAAGTLIGPEAVNDATSGSKSIRQSTTVPFHLAIKRNVKPPVVRKYFYWCCQPTARHADCY